MDNVGNELGADLFIPLDTAETYIYSNIDCTQDFDLNSIPVVFEEVHSCVENVVEGNIASQEVLHASTVLEEYSSRKFLKASSIKYIANHVHK